MTASGWVLATQKPGNVTGHTTSGRSDARRRALERLGELHELVLVAEHELDTACRDPRVEAGQLLERRAHPRGQRGIDRRGPNPRLLPGAGPLRPLLGRTHGQSLAHDL